MQTVQIKRLIRFFLFFTHLQILRLILERSKSSSSNDTSTRRERRATQEEQLTYALDRLKSISSAIDSQSVNDDFHHFG